jgi:hypothetical protein
MGTQVLVPHRPTSVVIRQAQIFLMFFLASTLSVPPTMMVHEFGHLIAAIVLGFHQVRLHYESVSYADQYRFWGLIQSGTTAQAAKLTPFWRVAVMEIAGPLASIVTLFVVGKFAKRYWIANVIGAVAVWRFIAPALFLWVNFRNARRGLPPMHHWGLDEFDFALLTGIPVQVTFAVELTLIVVGLVFLGGTMQRGTRLSAWGAMLCGTFVGVHYWYMLGPRILP